MSAPRDRDFDWEEIRRRLGAAAAATTTTAAERMREILDARARRLAQPAAVDDAREAIDVLTFTLGPVRYAIEHACVQEVVRFVSITPVPGTPAFVVGVTNHRGQVLCLFDLRELLGVPSTPLNDLAHIVVMGRETPEFGLLADRTDDTRRIAVADIIGSAPELAGSGDPRLYKGITGDGLVVLDGAVLLRDTRLVIDREP